LKGRKEMAIGFVRKKKNFYLTKLNTCAGLRIFYMETEMEPLEDK